MSAKFKIFISSLIFALFTTAGLAASCQPDDLELSARDFSRLATIDQNRIKAFGEAMMGEKPDRSLLSSLYRLGLNAPKTVPLGDYQCRTIKLGGLSALTAYSYFACRIFEDAGQLKIEKLTGSQRFTGDLYMQETGVAYRGASHYGYEEPRQYEGTTDRDQVGCIYESNAVPGTLLLELPQPHFESTHDIIELRPNY
jgi:hypothetical protein